MKNKWTRQILLTTATVVLLAAPGAALTLAPHFPTKEEILEEHPEAETGAQESESSADSAGRSDETPAENGTDAGEDLAENGEAGGETPTEGGEDVGEALTENGEAIGETPTEGGEDAGEALTENGEAIGEDAKESLTENGEESGKAAEPYPAFIPGALALRAGYPFRAAHPVPLPEHTLTTLSARLRRMFQSYDGEWSACVIDLATGERMVIHDAAMPSASTMKLFILGAVYEAIDAGRLERTSELVDRMNSMIRASSNEAANRLIASLGDGDYADGIAVINDYILRSGYSEMTRAYNPFQDSSLVLDSQHANQTSARDCADLMERIYHRSFGRRRVCNEIEEMLLNQQTRYKIPKGIPEEASVGNKTGETDTTENDVAVVYTPAGDYVLTIFSTGWRDKRLAQSRFAELSREVYSYFTDPEYIESRYREEIIDEGLGQNLEG